MTSTSVGRATSNRRSWEGRGQRAKLVEAVIVHSARVTSSNKSAKVNETNQNKEVCDYECEVVTSLLRLLLSLVGQFLESFQGAFMLSENKRYTRIIKLKACMKSSRKSKISIIDLIITYLFMYVKTL